MKPGEKVRFSESYEREHGYHEVGVVQREASDDRLVVLWPRYVPACSWGCHPSHVSLDIETVTPRGWLRPA